MNWWLKTKWYRLAVLVGAGACLFRANVNAMAAETAHPTPMSKTFIVLTVDATEPLAVHTKFREQPPTIDIQFPARRVIASLPERSSISRGVIRELIARYQPGTGSPSKRFLESMHVVLSAPYAYRVRSEPGRIIVEVEHPASVGSASVEVGLRGGTILEGLERASVSERFRAMQEALTRATPIPWTLQLRQEETGVDTSLVESERPSVVATPATAPGVTQVAQPSAPRSTSRATHPTTSLPSIWSAVAFSLIVVAAWVFWFLSRGDWLNRLIRRQPTVSARMPSGLVLIDQLVWRAFERQGYQLVTESSQASSSSTLRILSKEGIKSALLFVGSGPFFEKQMVEQFIRSMREAEVEQGFLVASGSFTVPAQRLAKTHRISLIGREQLSELLSAGASSEYFTRQLEQQHARLEEAKETLRQYAAELDTLRRQRNEASWHLGEEQAKSAELEVQLTEVGQQLQRHEAELARWQEEASTLRKQWEESQWYLGESQVRLRYLESQLNTLQEALKDTERIKQEGAEANWYLGEERVKREQLEAVLARLQKDLEASQAREAEWQRALEQAKAELDALRTHWGERRAHTRLQIPQANVELWNGEPQPFFSGCPRDISSNGVGLETSEELPAQRSFRLRLMVPGQEPIESAAQLIWQQAEGTPPRYQSGYQLIDLPETIRTRIEEFIQQAHPG